MIFGFNTDIKVRDTVYHVQTEVREQEQRLESQVFISGRCIGKRSTPLSSNATEGAQELARAQHRWIVDAVREGFVDDVLNQETTEELAVQFLNSQRISAAEALLRFRVFSRGFAVASARVEARWEAEFGSALFKSTPTNQTGVAEMRLALIDGASELEVRAYLEGRETVRRFLVKSAGS
ncbi:MAG: hypothetical protein CXZ00_06195 [Acidobacteria bacterium]|nr:MAG: hypothetical protein CXZ00_06195 [Acidobacteriota bacterium]